MAENLEVLRVFATLHLNTLGQPDLNTKDLRGWTLLHRLAQTHCNEVHPLCAVIWMCVKQGRCDVRIRDSQGRTPLHLALIAKNECAVKAFLELLSPVNTVDAYKRTPLISAINTGKVDFVRRLLFSGASFYRVDAYLTTKGDEISKEIRDLLIGHRTRLCAATNRARYYKDPVELPPPPPLQSAVQPIRRVVLPAIRPIKPINTPIRIRPLDANQRVATGLTRVMQPSLRPATRLVFTPRTPTQPQSAPRNVTVSRTLPPNVVIRSNAPPQSPMPQQVPPHARPSRQKTPAPPRSIRNLPPNVEVRPNSPPHHPMPQEQPRVTPFQQAPARSMTNLPPNVIRRPLLTSHTCNSTVGHQNLNPPPRPMFPGSTFVTVTDPIEKVRPNQPTRHRSLSPQPGPSSATRPTVTPYHPLHFQPPRRQRQQPPTPGSESRPNPGVFRSSRF